MKKIEAIVQPFKLQDVKTALSDIGIEGMTITDVRGHGRQRGHDPVYRGQEYRADIIPKTKIEIIVNDADLEDAITAIRRAASTGRIGDGKIFIFPISGAIRIRNGQEDEAAI
jgi:nitrogen regulatory protein P-II 1